MKRIVLIVSLVLVAVLCPAQTVIDRALQDELDRCGDNEKIPILVLMKAQYDRTRLNQQADFCPNRAARRDFIVSELKAFAEDSQYDLKQSLAEMQQNGLVSEPKMLWSANALFFSARKSAILEIAQRNDIEMIGFDHKENLIPETEAARPSSASREITPNVFQVNADKVWELGYKGEGVIVSVLDSGVNYNHLDLADHLWDGGEEFPHHGYDVVNGDDDPMDDKGHGTHCAGTVVGDGTAGSLTGIAPDATLMCVKSIAADGFGGSVNIAGGMEWSVEHGCDLISMSVGMVNSEIPDRELLRRTCVSILNAGIVAVVCAGNEGLYILQLLYPIPNNVRVPASCPPPYLDPDQLENPGALSCVIAVGAVNGNDQAADFTSQGPVTWTNTEFGDYAYDPGIGLIRPDICAPGVGIKSLDYLTTNGYCTMDGTSQATPCVAGVIALMLSKNPELTPSDICRIIEETSLKLSDHKSNITGVGRIDALAAIQQVPDHDGVEELLASQVLVYPNPSLDNFIVECDGMTEIDIFSMDGRLVKKIATNNRQCHIDELNKGIYLLKVNTINGTSIQKIVKL